MKIRKKEERKKPVRFGKKPDSKKQFDLDDDKDEFELQFDDSDISELASRLSKREGGGEAATELLLREKWSMRSKLRAARERIEYLEQFEPTEDGGAVLSAAEVAEYEEYRKLALVDGKQGGPSDLAKLLTDSKQAITRATELEEQTLWTTAAEVCGFPNKEAFVALAKQHKPVIELREVTTQEGKKREAFHLLMSDGKKTGEQPLRSFIENDPAWKPFLPALLQGNGNSADASHEDTGVYIPAQPSAQDSARGANRIDQIADSVMDSMFSHVGPKKDK